MVQAFDGCGGASSLCVEVRYLAQMFRETYTNWLWFNSHTTIGGPNAPQPGGFLTPPTSFYQKTGIWTTAQVANGPVGTNGTNIYYCGSPTFNGSITALSNPPLTQSTGCTDPPLTATSAPPMPPTGMPPPGDLPPTTALNTLQAIAADEPCTPSPAIGLFCYGPSPHPYDLTGNNDIRLYPSTRPGYSLISITGASGSATVQWPSHRLLYDSGDLTVTSTPNYAPGNVPSITLAASGDVVIQGNLQVPLNEPTPASGCIYPVSGIGKTFMTPSDSCTGIIGIIAGRNIILSPNSNAAGHYADQSVDAVLFALSGAVYDEAWNVPAASCGSLYFVGSIIEDYQGLFGTGAQGTAGVTTGYQTNNFYYDTRLEDPQLQPPHFFLPAASQWQSLSLAEVPSQ